MGRRESEAVVRYTRLAPLDYPMAAPPASPPGLATELVQRCGVTADSAQEALPEGPGEGSGALMWVMNLSSGIQHLAATAGPPRTQKRTLCGWHYTRAPHAAEAPSPKYFWLVCSSCAPATRALMKSEAGPRG